MQTVIIRYQTPLFEKENLTRSRYTYREEHKRNIIGILCIGHFRLNEMLKQHSFQLHGHSVQVADRSMYQWSGSDWQSSNSHIYKYEQEQISEMVPLKFAN